MALRKRGQTWWLDIATPGGHRLRRSTETTDRKAAQELHDKLKADLWRQAKLGDKPKYTWEDAALRWLNELNCPLAFTLATGTTYWLAAG